MGTGVREAKVRPSVHRVERGDETERLYALEHERNELIDRCAAEWGRLHGFGKAEMWTRLIPQALFDVMESYERASAELAAIAYLEHRGFVVDRMAGRP